MKNELDDDRPEKRKIKIFVPEIPTTESTTTGDKLNLPCCNNKNKNPKKDGLLGVLPPPKRSIETSNKAIQHDRTDELSEKTMENINRKIINVNNFIPIKPKTDDDDSTKVCKLKNVTGGLALITAYDSDNSDQDDNDFFNLKKSVINTIDDHSFSNDFDNNTIVESAKNDSNHTEHNTNYTIHNNTDEYCNYQLYEAEKSEVEHAIDDKFLKRLTGDRKRRHPINFIDINADQLKNQDIDALKQLTQENETSYTGSFVNGESKRRHQITYLALQARQMETQLKNKWAKSRANRQQSRMKYGF